MAVAERDYDYASLNEGKELSGSIDHRFSRKAIQAFDDEIRAAGDLPFLDHVKEGSECTRYPVGTLICTDPKVAQRVIQFDAAFGAPGFRLHRLASKGIAAGLLRSGKTDV
ncbi:hypothetical protein DFR48_10729 [Ciceribacter lividus]|uniref:Uncharacterized protein n=1 Tax=Ciceribacter lividus TaxID=1197950 RepID=A0A6I7HJM6_9HYPH|nr:hypothetical protein DFR48_10729 [Ciceribacter lividus]